MKNEIWRDIKGYEGLYQISNLGRVKSLGRKSYSNVCLKDKILNPALECKNGYKRVCLCKDGKEKRIKVGNSYRYIDLVFFNIDLNCYICCGCRITNCSQTGRQ